MPIKIDPFVFARHFPTLFFEFIAVIFGLILGLLLLKKYLERKTLPTLYLSLAFFAVAFGTGVAFFNLVLWWMKTTESIIPYVTSPEIYITSFTLTFPAIVIYNIMTFLFANELFLVKKKWPIIPIVIIGVLIVIMVYLPTNYWGVTPIPYIDSDSTRSYTSLLFLLYNSITFLILAYYAFKDVKNVEQKDFKIGLQLIGLGSILSLNFFLMFLLDAIVILFNPFDPGYTIFISIGWISTTISFIIYYLGVILPEWFKKLILKE